MSFRQTIRRLALACSLACALAAGQASAATLYSSPMTAPPLTAGNLVGQDGWTAHSGAGVIPIQVGASGTLLDSTAGGTREDANVAITPIAAGQTYYFGFDVAVSGTSGVTPTNVYFAHFKDIASDFTVRTFITAFAGADYTFGLSPAGSTPDVTWAAGLTYGQTYRVVGSYNADTRENKLWVDPLTEASTSLSATDSAANAIAGFAFRQATANTTQLVTNLAVGTSFNDVVSPVPEPSSIALAGCGICVAAGAAYRRRGKQAAQKVAA